jgi:hypothetical protein
VSELEYKAITSENFYFNEIRNVSKFLMDKDLSIDEYKNELEKEDILNVKSKSNFQKKFLSMKKRVPFLTKNLMYFLINEDSDIGKFINLYCIVASERIIFEFFADVVKLKVESYDMYISNFEFEKFMILKSEQSKVVDSWTDAGKKKIITKLKNFLLEGGYLYRHGEQFRISKPIIPLEIINEIERNGNKKVLKAMLF